MFQYDLKIDLNKYGLKKDDSWFHEMITDAHIGHPNFAKAEFQRALDRICNEPNRSTHFNGDNTDNMPPTHKWFDQAQADLGLLEIPQQIGYFWKLIDPLVKVHETHGNKILGFIEGNHEYNRGLTSTAFKYAYCKPEIDENGQVIRYKYRYLGYAAYLTFNFFWKKEHLNSFTMLVSHGSYNGDQRGGDINNMGRSAAIYEADIRLEGHSHDKWIDIPTYYKPVVQDDYTTKIVEAERLIGNGGCFARGVVMGRNNYNEKRLFRGRAAKIGTITVGMNPYTGKLSGFL
jgi:hypothetical protein